ncbi:MAG: HAD-IA family hydrolase [Rhodocyclaceae bacterium]|nr:HAD-IA family hydrolase [Rhodocyclaceae bacterium]
MDTLQALIFDVDGTLADTERDGHRAAFNLAFADAGLDWHWDEPLYGELLAVTGGKERIRFFVERHLPKFAARPDFDALVKALHATKTVHFVRLVEAGQLPLRPGVARIIAEARAAGLRLAIATTTSPENVEVLLRASLAPEALDWFEVIGAGDIVPAKKPAPDIYQWVLERLNLPAAACLALEDSENGLKSSRAAGIQTLITENAYTHGQDFTGALKVLPDLAATTLADLRNIFGGTLSLA